VKDVGNSDCAEAVEKEIIVGDDKSSLMSSGTLVEVALSRVGLELIAAAGRSVIATGEPVWTGELMIVDESSWLKDAISVITLPSSALVTEDGSSASTVDTMLLGEGSVLMAEVASAIYSEDGSVTGCTSELVTSSGRPVSCVKSPVAVLRSEYTTTELVLATPSTALALAVSIASDTVIATEPCPDTTLEGMSVTRAGIEESVAISGVFANWEVSVWASAIEVTGGVMVISARLLEGTGSVACVRTSVTLTDPVSMGKKLALVASGSIPELAVSGRSDKIVSEEISWEIALDGTSVTEESVEASVMGWGIADGVIESDVIDGNKSVVSARALVSEGSDRTAELSTTIELGEEMSWAVELVSISLSPVSRDSGARVAEVSRSEMVLDGTSGVTGMNPVAESEDRPVAEGIAKMFVVISGIVSDDTEVSEGISKLDVMDGSCAISSRALEVTDSGSMIELSTTDVIKDEASWMIETLSTELMAEISGAVVTEERISSVVMDGISLVAANTDVASSVGAALVEKGTEMSDRSSELIVVDGNSVASWATLVGGRSRLMTEVSAADSMIEEESWMTALTSR
jgi:hypothetical protein